MHNMAIKIDGDITIKDGNTDLKKLKELVPVELWSGSSSSGNITLADSCANYSYIDVVYMSRVGAYTTSRIYNPNGKMMNLTSGNGEHMEGYYMYNTVELSFSGTSVTRTHDRLITIQNNTAPKVGTTVSYYTLTITNIIGYK